MDELTATDGEYMGLEISRVHAKLDIQTTPSRLDIQTRKAKLEFRNKRERVDVRTELPRVIIDQSECFASMGLMKPVDLTRQEGQWSMQHALTYASKVSGDGDSVAAIENPQDPMPDIVERDTYPEREFVLDFIPKARPRINVTGGVQINTEKNAEGTSNGVQATYTPPEIRIDHKASQVRIRMAQYPSIRMRYVPGRFNKYV
jgi:hypothetical protein